MIILNRMQKYEGDEFPRSEFPPVTAVLHYHWLAAGLHDKIISHGVGGHSVYVGVRHPKYELSARFRRHILKTHGISCVAVAKKI